MRSPRACSRRQFLSRSSLAMLGLGTGAVSLANPTNERLYDGSAAKGMINTAAQKAIDSGLDYLVRRQNPDGSFGERQYRGNVAITGLVGLALMAGGHQPGRGAKGKVVTEAIKYVLTQEDSFRSGYFHKSSAGNHGPMYEHGFGTLFLAEAHGAVHEPKLRAELEKKLTAAVALIQKSQNREGGWRYEPGNKDADLSVTICQIMALRSARNAGMVVPKSLVDKCTEYVKACQSSDGSFRYMKQGGKPTFALTAAGVVALYSAGIYKGQEIENGLKYLLEHKPGQAVRRDDIHHYFYGQYYAVQAMWTAGGSAWSEWYPAIRDELVGRARRDEGGWHDPICSHYGTAMACIILQVPNNYLAILQK